MIPLCLVLGDSTAVGTADALAAEGMRCAVHARSGAPSTETVRTWRSGAFSGRTLIALGSNDALNPKLSANLELLRRRLSASHVTWLAPYHPRAAAIVTAIADKFGDTVVYLGRFSSNDGIHPKSYRTVASALRWDTQAHRPYDNAIIRPRHTATPSAPPVVRAAVVISF